MIVESVKKANGNVCKDDKFQNVQMCLNRHICIVFELSKFIVIPMLSEWVDMKSLARMDSAVCHTEFRNMFLDYVSHPTAVYREHKVNITLNWQQMIWMQLRNISVRHMYVTLDLPSMEFDFDKFYFRNTTHLTIYGINCHSHMYEEKVNNWKCFLRQLTSVEVLEVKFCSFN